MPLVASALSTDSITSAGTWAADHRDEIQQALSRAGVVLIRGLPLAQPADFRAVCGAIETDLKPYTGGDSPRSVVADKVYTSTEYDAHLEVLLHNELSYAGWSPRLVFFGCMVNAEAGGETPIADGRVVYHRIPERIRNQFESRGVAYLQHLWDAEGKPGIGKSWQETFSTDERSSAEQYLVEAGMTLAPLHRPTRPRKATLHKRSVVVTQ